MQLHKTDKARSALLERTGTLTAHDRRILILSDGRRSLDDIVALLGSSARPAVLRLVEERYLATSHGVASAPVVASVPVVVPLVAPPVAATIAPIASKATRRSLAATKMYMLDMLQLQRDPEAAEIKAAIQTSIGPETMIAAVLRGLQHIQRMASASYSQRVFDHVAEMIPEEALPALRAKCAPPYESVEGLR